MGRVRRWTALAACSVATPRERLSEPVARPAPHRGNPCRAGWLALAEALPRCRRPGASAIRTAPGHPVAEWTRADRRLVPIGRPCFEAHMPSMVA